MVTGLRQGMAADCAALRSVGVSIGSRRWWIAVAAVLVLLSGCAAGDGQTPVSAPAPAPADPGLAAGVVHTAAGAVRGQIAPDYLLFQGIPYAAAPVGELRWQPPAPVPAWSGMRDASKPGTRCVQDTNRDPDYGLPTGEDCLNLNVWSPTGAAGRPVLVWIHGGAFANGSADLYDARWLVTKGDIVVVTVNYRLGAPGFLADPALGADGEVGNYGLADQQAALRWVRDNIAGFGGDPAKVTLAGQSAGGMSVCDHLVAPGSAGLFRSAIIASGPCSAQGTLADARRDSVAYAAGVGCTDRADAARCLRALPPGRLVEPPWFYRIGANTLSGPVIGGPELPVDPVAALADGQGGTVPLLIGTTRDEFTFFMALQYLRLGHVPAAADYPRMLREVFGRDAGAVEANYPLPRFRGDVALAYAGAVTDSYFSCVGDRIAAGQSADAPVYAYEFSDRQPPTPQPLLELPFPVGASHGLDLRYLFDIGGAPPLNPAQQRLSDQMIGYWSSFVSTGVPTADGAPDWPALDNAGTRMSFDAAGSRLSTSFRADHRCAFWASLR